MELLKLRHFNKLPDGRTQGLNDAVREATEFLRTGKHAFAVFSVEPVKTHIFYRTVVIPSSIETIIDAGYSITPTKLHDLFKTDYNYGDSTMGMNSVEWKGFLNRINAYLCNEYHVGIPNRYEWVNKITLLKGEAKCQTKKSKK